MDEQPARVLKKLPRWVRSMPPNGAIPNFNAPWLGKLLSCDPQYDADWNLTGYRAIHEKAGLRYWIWIKYSEHDLGRWKCRRPSIHERAERKYPEIYAWVAKQIQGRERITVKELAPDAVAENPHSHKVKSVAFALRKLGWIGLRTMHERYYVHPKTLKNQ